MQGDLQQTMDELHKVLTRREHTFAVFEDVDGNRVGLRPDAVQYVRLVTPDAPSAAGP